MLLFSFSSLESPPVFCLPLSVRNTGRLSLVLRPVTACCKKRQTPGKSASLREPDAFVASAALCCIHPLNPRNGASVWPAARGNQYDSNYLFTWNHPPWANSYAPSVHAGILGISVFQAPINKYTVIHSPASIDWEGLLQQSQFIFYSLKSTSGQMNNM